ncbi:hypothetical protein AXF42_Ash009266 [Apostasia shenzhenica]|uniref:R3H domain-containing protein 2 n=1 Tax=Apostasia shenzhenica TaxID=1088818 RepID=A0A2I0B3L3_9ASPA|nr:hypothetical protein AXF42_Ash009266 [Apostasia shenzhenica]
MEGSADDLGAPDSWESADLDEAMSRLMVSSKKSSDSFLSFQPLPQEFPEDAPSLPPAAAGTCATVGTSSFSVERRCSASEDELNQVDQFLREALEKPRERLSILRMEQDIIKFICDPNEQQLEFQDLPTSYLRLAAHRVAQHYFLQSIAMPDSILADGSGSRIVIRKTSFCRLAPIRLADIPVSLQQEDANNAVKIAIKQRPQNRSQAGIGMSTHSSNSNSLKTVEERKEEYNKARARIFSGKNGSGTSSRTEAEPILPDIFQDCPLVQSKSEDVLISEVTESNLNRSMSNSSIGSSRTFRNRQDKEPIVGRQKTINRVAVFRDRDMDRKDPDYDRSYDRYMQRFDPGFGFNSGHYTMQPLYAPAVNYNTEFPQLGSNHRPQISIEHQPRPIAQQLRGSWPTPSTSSTINYGPPEGLIAPYNPNHVGAHPTSSIFLHSSQFSMTPRPMPYLHSHEHVQPFPQVHVLMVSRFFPNASETM